MQNKTMLKLKYQNLLLLKLSCKLSTRFIPCLHVRFLFKNNIYIYIESNKKSY